MTYGTKKAVVQKYESMIHTLCERFFKEQNIVKDVTDDHISDLEAKVMDVLITAGPSGVLHLNDAFESILRDKKSNSSSPSSSPRNKDKRKNSSDNSKTASPKIETASGEVMDSTDNSNLLAPSDSMKSAEKIMVKVKGNSKIVVNRKNDIVKNTNITQSLNSSSRSSSNTFTKSKNLEEIRSHVEALQIQGCLEYSPLKMQIPFLFHAVGMGFKDVLLSAIRDMWDQLDFSYQDCYAGNNLLLFAIQFGSPSNNRKYCNKIAGKLNSIKNDMELNSKMRLEYDREWKTIVFSPVAKNKKNSIVDKNNNRPPKKKTITNFQQLEKTEKNSKRSRDEFDADCEMSVYKEYDGMDDVNYMGTNSSKSSGVRRSSKRIKLNDSPLFSLHPKTHCLSNGNNTHVIIESSASEDDEMENIRTPTSKKSSSPKNSSPKNKSPSNKSNCSSKKTDEETYHVVLPRMRIGRPRTTEKYCETKCKKYKAAGKFSTSNFIINDVVKMLNRNKKPKQENGNSTASSNPLLAKSNGTNKIKSINTQQLQQQSILGTAQNLPSVNPPKLKSLNTNAITGKDKVETNTLKTVTEEKTTTPSHASIVPPAKPKSQQAAAREKLQNAWKTGDVSSLSDPMQKRQLTAAIIRAGRMDEHCKLIKLLLSHPKCTRSVILNTRNLRGENAIDLIKRMGFYHLNGVMIETLYYDSNLGASSVQKTTF